LEPFDPELSPALNEPQPAMVQSKREEDEVRVSKHNFGLVKPETARVAAS
jgi:hypothetical protein